MSESHPQATETTTPEQNRWDLLELDIPEPKLPAWLATVITAIAAILPGVVGADAAFEALRALLTPLGKDPRWMALADTDPGKIAARAAKDAKLAEINALRAPQPQQRQAVPVIQASPPVPLASLMPQAQAVSAAVTVAPATPLGVVVVGEWRKHKSGGEQTWCAMMPLAPNTRAPRVGDIVAVARRNGHRENKRVTKCILTDAYGHLVAVESTTELPTYRTGVAAPQHADTTAALAAIASELTAPVNSELAQVDSALATDLALAAGESQANANTQASGSMQAGTMRGVGFSNAAGYIQALANGVKAGTAQSYKQTLRGSYGYTNEQIAALVVTIIPEADLPVGAGIVHAPTGPSVFDKPRSERTFKVGATTTRADVQRLIGERDLIAGAIADGSHLQVSWTGEGSNLCGKIRDALTANGLERFAPNPPSAERHAGKAVESVRGEFYDTMRLKGTMPEGVAARWAVGRKVTARVARSGQEFGNIALVVSLLDDGSLSFDDGDATIAASIRGKFIALTEHEVMHSDVLTPWLNKILFHEFRAVKRGHVWYVPGGYANDVQALIDTIAPLWGDHETMPVTSGKRLMMSLTRGLLDEVAALVKELADKTLTAQKAAEKKARAEFAGTKEEGTHGAAQAIELAIKRAAITSYAASAILSKLALVAARTEGYAAALGDDSVVAVKASIGELRAKLEPLADDASARAAMLEFA